jgi:hypothetical protein
MLPELEHCAVSFRARLVLDERGTGRKVSYRSQPKLRAMRSGGAISVNPSASCLPKPCSAARNALMPHMLWALRAAEPGKGPCMRVPQAILYAARGSRAGLTLTISCRAAPSCPLFRGHDSPLLTTYVESGDI